MKLLLFIIIMLVCANIVIGLPMIYSKTYWETPMRFCGGKLPREMAIICNGRYNEDNGVQQTKIKRGITDECCSVPCKRQYLKDYYCAPEPQISNTEMAVTTARTTQSTGKPSTINNSIDDYPLIVRGLADFPKNYPFK